MTSSNPRRAGIAFGVLALAAVTACSSSSSPSRGSSGGATSGGVSGGGKYSISYSVPLSTTDPQTLTAEQFAKTVEKSSGGAITVHVYPNNQLGTQTAIDQDVANGSIQIVSTDPGDLTNLYPQLAVLQLPFQFASRSQVLGDLSGSLGAALSKSMTSQVNITPLAWQDLGWIDLLSNSPVSDLSALQGMKVRTGGSSVDDATYSAVGAIPVPLDIGEVYTSLQTGTVGGADLPITPVYSLKLYEAAKYLTITDSYYQVAGIFISSKFLNSLPANLQKDVETAAAQAAAQQQAQANAVTNSALKAMETAGVKVITLPSAARSQWAAKADQTAVKPFESKYGTQFVDLINAGS